MSIGPPVVKVYYGIIQRIDGPTADQGCQNMKFSGTAVASWNQEDILQFDSLPPAERSLPSCDVVVTAPEVGDFCEIWVGPEEKLRLFLKTAQLPAIECV